MVRALRLIGPDVRRRNATHGGEIVLVLSRKIGEAIVIGSGIVVRVLEAGAGRARLGVEAPDEVLVLREKIAARPDIPSTRVESKPILARVTRT